MSKTVKNSIKAYYTFKKYRNQIIPKEILRSIRTRPWVCIQWSSEGTIVKDICLIHRDYIGSMRKMGVDITWNIYHANRIIGTKLFMYDGAKIPWWKLPEYGTDITPIYEDILPEHLSKKIKYREEVLIYLEYIKKSFVGQQQLILPGFE